MRNPFRSTKAMVATAVATVLVAGGVIAAVALGSAGTSRPAALTAPTSTTSTTTAPTTTTTARHTKARRAVKKPHKHHHAPAPIVAPLTGEPATAQVAARPAVVVKIDNITQALPQTGVNQADVVYEELVEGGLTRLAAIFQSQQPPRVEPVRSGRLTDIGIADDLDHPVLAYSGTNGIFQPVLAAQPVQDVTAETNPDLFFRDDTRDAPHNLYASVAALAATDKPSKPPSSRFFSFRPAGTSLRGAGVAKASGVSIPFPAASISWAWDAKTHLWQRTQNAAADLDSTGAQLTANNVIVQFVPYITSAYATGEGNAVPVPIPEGILTGKGTAWVLSAGAIVKGTWSRSGNKQTTVFKTTTGKVIRLAPGRTWIELAPTGTAATVTG